MGTISVKLSGENSFPMEDRLDNGSPTLLVLRLASIVDN